MDKLLLLIEACTDLEDPEQCVVAFRISRLLVMLNDQNLLERLLMGENVYRLVSGLQCMCRTSERLHNRIVEQS